MRSSYKKFVFTFISPRKEEKEQEVGAVYCKNIDDLLQQSDFVMLVVNLTSETHNLIGKRELELMKPTATLINICRGRMQRYPNVYFCCLNRQWFRKHSWRICNLSFFLIISWQNFSQAKYIRLKFRWTNYSWCQSNWTASC